MGARRKAVTLRDVAAAAAVSLGTASHALNDSPLIRPETRARVHEAARRLGYAPNRNVTRLFQGRTDCVGVVFAHAAPTLSGDALHFLMLQGITETLEEHSYTMRHMRLDRMLESAQLDWRQRLTAQDVDGLITMNWMHPAVVVRLQEIGVPLVALDSSGAYPDLLSVDADERGGVALGVAHLLGLGHRRIALLNLPLDYPYPRETLAGYRDAFAQMGVSVDSSLLCHCPFSIAGGRLAMDTLLSGRQRPTAVFCVGDEIAMGATQAIHDRGLRVPDDVSVVGLSDIPLAAQVHPALTTVRVDGKELGRRATRLLLSVLAGGDPSPRRVVLPTQLIVRDSTAEATG
jgi:LacI family transcriptional regulator